MKARIKLAATRTPDGGELTLYRHDQDFYITINGHDLMALGVSEGPIMKEILNAIYELQLELKFKSKEDAILYVKEKLINQ